MIAFARYIVLSNQDADVYLEWQKSQSELKMKQAATQVYLDKQLAPVFEGYLPCISKDNEASAWRYIDKACDESLAKYPTTLEQDVEIIEKDTEE